MGLEITGVYAPDNLYLCDPQKNVDCPKDICQTECFYTTKKEFSKDGKVYRYNHKTCELDEYTRGRYVKTNNLR